MPVPETLSATCTQAQYGRFRGRQPGYSGSSSVTSLWKKLPKCGNNIGFQPAEKCIQLPELIPYPQMKAIPVSRYQYCRQTALLHSQRECHMQGICLDFTHYSIKRQTSLYLKEVRHNERQKLQEICHFVLCENLPSFLFFVILC